ncbi:MAG: alanine/glycine:cation symporter family protein [Bacteroidales bacterium]|jgi:AGCS family alanine or glycine:cation symporter|nr:alanine/glycine:cation symporter family protein [Bacteroidales bacterium]MDD2687133.1 alanine/glycine:cation symporter family protein [Bacteroidales bacterium]MDD3329717.1 alanine/glycine:cation symporter family protein [Bacteroidales bacterium]MDD3690493.1 alanine/glycine:cation symporter family protein [Bacteroidales bacterium]MDD4045328.1 alanine/glycine:cation symporter family protein [Bacteroidales bacterium]
MLFEDIVAFLVKIVWSPALIVVCLFGGLLFSILTRFVQVRRFKEMIQLLFVKKNKEKSGVSSFQAFCMAISGRVGTGNIVGVATAIAFGGPGSIFWMWIIAFLGASSAFVESTLAQIYKEKHGQQLRGGPSYYIEKGLHCKWLAIAFAISTIAGCGFLLPSVQSNGVASAFNIALGIEPIYIGVALSLVLGFVIIGGVKRIANVAEVIAPFMAIGYMLVALMVLSFHWDKIPGVFALIFQSAFGFHPIYGAIIGSTIMWGVKRGIFSNEAGQGSCPIIAAAAEVSHPVQQGLVQAFSVYIDTLLICTATAVMILVTGMYNVFYESGLLLVENAPALGNQYVAFTQGAIDKVFPGFGNLFVASALLFFVFTTLMAYYYYAETSIVYLFGKKKKRGNYGIWGLRILIVLAVFYGSIKQATLAWQLGDIGVGLMAWINLIAIFLLFPKAIRSLKDYENQKKKGINPSFDPDKLRIPKADFWKKTDI